MEKSELVFRITILTHRCVCKLMFYNDSSYCIQEKTYWIWQPHNFTHTSGSTWSMHYSAVPCSVHCRITLHHLHLNIFLAVECLPCFQTVLRNAVHSHNSCQHRMLMSILQMSHFYKFIPLLQYICDLIKLKKHSTVKELKAVLVVYSI